MKGVRFGEFHSWDDFSLILSQKIIGTPSPKTETIDIPGGDGVLDLTEVFGEVKYNNRNLSFDFSTKVPQSEFMDLFSRVQNALHGQRMQIVLDDDPEWYYTGRISVSEWKAEKNIGKLKIECDCEPWKYKAAETVISVPISGTEIVVLSNSRKRVVPVITTTASFTFSWGSYSRAISAGTFQIPELELKEGNNTITVSGTGTLSFRYAEGGL